MHHALVVLDDDTIHSSKSVASYKFATFDSLLSIDGILILCCIDVKAAWLE